QARHAPAAGAGQHVPRLLIRVQVGRDGGAGGQVAQADLQVDGALGRAHQDALPQAGHCRHIGPTALAPPGHVIGHAHPSCVATVAGTVWEGRRRVAAGSTRTFTAGAAPAAIGASAPVAISSSGSASGATSAQPWVRAATRSSASEKSGVRAIPLVPMISFSRIVARRRSIATGRFCMPTTTSLAPAGSTD